MATTITIETFVCEECGYHQNFDPFVEGVMARNFPEFPGIMDGACPACFSGRNAERVQRNAQLSRTIDLSQLSVVTASSDDELSAQTKAETDTDGQVVMIESGKTQPVLINDNGTPRFIEESVFEPKQRELTKSELAELKEQRDRNLDALSSIAVTEISPDILEADPAV